MKKLFSICIMVLSFHLASSSTTEAQDREPRHLVQTIPMPNLKGRIDHMNVDVKGKRLFVAGLDNGSLEVIDLQAGKWSKSIPGVKKTQGIAYVPFLNKVFVPSGDDGMVRAFRGDTLELLDAIKLDLGPNGIVYDPQTRLLYVGYETCELLARLRIHDNHARRRTRVYEQPVRTFIQGSVTCPVATKTPGGNHFPFLCIHNLNFAGGEGEHNR